MDRDRLVGIALALLSAASFGVMPVLTKVVYADGVGPYGVLSVRFTLAAVVLLALARLRGEVLPRGRVLVALVLMGSVGYVLQSLFYFTALETISAGLTALLLYAHPALVVLLAAALARRWPRPVVVLCVVTATVGTALTIGPVGGGQTVGVLLGLASAVVYAVYIVVGSRVRTVGPFGAAAVVMGSAGVVYDVLAVSTGAPVPSTAASWAALAGVALVGGVVAVAAFFAALARLGPADTSVVSTAEPVVSVAVGALVLSERLGPVQVAGGVLVLLAVGVLARLAPPAEAEPAPV